MVDICCWKCFLPKARGRGSVFGCNCLWQKVMRIWKKVYCLRTNVITAFVQNKNGQRYIKLLKCQDFFLFSLRKTTHMLRKLRIAFAIIFFTGITLLFLDFSGTIHTYVGWMAKMQLLPAVLALNVVVVIGLLLLSILFGRAYCSVINLTFIWR